MEFFVVAEVDLRKVGKRSFDRICSVWHSQRLWQWIGYIRGKALGWRMYLTWLGMSALASVVFGCFYRSMCRYLYVSGFGCVADVLCVVCGV